MFYRNINHSSEKVGIPQCNSPYPGCFYIRLSHNDDLYIVLYFDRYSFTALYNGQEVTKPLDYRIRRSCLFFTPKEQLKNKKFYLIKSYFEDYKSRPLKTRGLRKVIKLCGGAITEKIKNADYIVWDKENQIYYPSHLENFQEKHNEKIFAIAKENNIPIINLTYLANMIRPGKKQKRKKQKSK